MKTAAAQRFSTCMMYSYNDREYISLAINKEEKDEKLINDRNH